MRITSCLNTRHTQSPHSAWEFASTDELWAGLIRNFYAKIEVRIASESNSTDSEDAPVDTDYLQRWRVNQDREAPAEGAFRRAHPHE